MRLICHRCNTIADLISTPTKYGVEVDIRSYGDRIVIHHDPFIKGPFFETWISNYQHGMLILNVKEEGLEERLIALMQREGITDYFFLDQSFPFIVKYSKLGEHRCAVRVSEFESINTAMTLAGKVDWVWVDCFTEFPLGYDDAKLLQNSGFRLCLVSPELQGRNPELEVPRLTEQLFKMKIEPDAVCTKRPDLWEKCWIQ